MTELSSELIGRLLSVISKKKNVEQIELRERDGGGGIKNNYLVQILSLVLYYFHPALPSVRPASLVTGCSLNRG